MKKSLLAALIFFSSILSVFADDSTGRVFFVRPGIRTDVFSFMNLLDEYFETDLGNDSPFALGVTGDFLWYLNDKTCLGIRSGVDFMVGVDGGRDQYDFLFGFHSEYRFISATAGLMMSITDLVLGYEEVSESHTGFWIELGYIQRFNSLPPGLVLEASISIYPGFSSRTEDEDGYIYNIENKSIRETLKFNIGFGITL